MSGPSSDSIASEIVDLGYEMLYEELDLPHEERAAWVEELLYRASGPPSCGRRPLTPGEEASIRARRLPPPF